MGCFNHLGVLHLGVLSSPYLFSVPCYASPASVLFLRGHQCVRIALLFSSYTWAALLQWSGFLFTELPAVAVRWPSVYNARDVESIGAGSNMALIALVFVALGSSFRHL